VDLYSLLRSVTASAEAVAKGGWNMATRSGETTPVALKPGDAAPPFTLTGSDQHTHRLSDYAGRDALVIAWFPKAFTGG
jgi:hypothetical protein